MRFLKEKHDDGCVCDGDDVESCLHDADGRADDQ